MAQCYLVPMTMESGPTKCSTRVSRNPDSFIQEEQSAPVQSKQMRTASAVRIDHRSGQQYVVHGSGDELGRLIRSIHSAVSRSYSAKAWSRVPVLSQGRIRWKSVTTTDSNFGTARITPDGTVTSFGGGIASAPDGTAWYARNLELGHIDVQHGTFLPSVTPPQSLFFGVSNVVTQLLDEFGSLVAIVARIGSVSIRHRFSSKPTA